MDAFGTRMSQFDLGANHSDALQEFSSHAARLMATIRGASSHSTSKAGQVAHQVVTALHWIHKDARDTAEAVRNYRSSAFEGKQIQERLTRTNAASSVLDLQGAILQQSTTALLLDFDRSWWTIR